MAVLLTKDQRGFTQPVNGACDIGAYEGRRHPTFTCHLDCANAISSPKPNRCLRRHYIGLTYVSAAHWHRSEDEWCEYYREHDPAFCNALNGLGKAYARVAALSSKIQRRAPPTSVLAIHVLVLKHCNCSRLF